MPDPAAASLPTVVFAHNWVEPPKLSSSYETQIEEHVDGTEQRRGLRGKPRRTMTSEGMTINAEDNGDLLLLLKKRAGGYVYMPLYSDASPTTGAVTGGTTIPCDTTYRRFFVGYKIVVIKYDDFNSSLSQRLLTIASLTSSSITTVETISGTIPAGSEVYPVIESDVQLGHNASLETDRVLTFKGSYFEHVNETAMPPLVDTGDIPTGVGSFRGLPVLDIEHNWETTEEGLLRKGTTTDIGLGSLTTLYGTDTLVTATLSFLQENRQEAWKVLEFFDSCRGSLMPFWYPHRAAVGIPTSATSNSITVPETIPLNEFTSRKVVAIWYTNGTVDVRFVTAGISSFGFNILTLNAALSSTDVSTMERLSFASLARFAKDEIVEEWETNQVMRTSLEVQGVPFNLDLSCIGLECEGGGCYEDDDCDGPDDGGPDDPGPPFKPKDRCLTGTASVPMYYDLTQSWNSGREAIRAADMPMPDTLYIEVRDTMVADTNHPYGQDISDELKSALFRTHELVYVGTIDRSAKSRNPHHLKVSGTGPYSYSFRSGGELVEDSPCWEAETEYVVGETTYTLTVRMYAEYIDQSASANGDSEYGAWGTIFTIWAFTDEITMSYTDGDPYVPFDSYGFTKEDPFVGGLYEGDAASVKRMHPQALFMATCPTTWHSPIGYSHYSRLSRDQYKSPCFAVDSGAPWSSGSAAEAIDNNAFGSTTTTAKLRGLGSLGGWNTSEFFNWACIENYAGTGKTILKPNNPGWDESVGDLSTYSDIRVDVCTPFHAGISACNGHPDDPYQGKGGTHDAFRDNTDTEDSDMLCYKTDEITSILVDQRCVVKTTTYDSACDIYSENCEEIPIRSSFQPQVEDYFFGDPEGNGTLRYIQFRQYVNDPEYVDQAFPDSDICDPQSDCWTARVGSGTVASEAVSVSVTGGKTVGGLLTYNVPTMADVVDTTITATTTRTGSQKIGLAVRAGYAAGSITEGYVGIVDEGAGTVTLYKVTASDTLTIMATESVTIPAGDYTFSMFARGSTITFTVTGSFVSSLSIEDCDHVDAGKPGLACLNVAGSFSGISVVDRNWQKLTIIANVTDKAEIYSIVPLEATRGWVKSQVGGSCEEICDPDCPSCPCTTICKSLHSVLSADSAGFMDA
jgi:hypothetical protein